MGQSRKEVEGLDVCWPDDSEVAAVKRCDLRDPKSLASCDDRCVDRAER